MSRYGNIMALSPSGASHATGAQDGKGLSGVRASQDMIDTDYGLLNAKKQFYVRVGNTHGIEPALIAAIASRESRGGKALVGTGGYGDYGKAYGLLQGDIAHSGLGSRLTSCGWDSYEHIDMLVREVLLDKIGTMQRRHPNWSREQQLQGGIAAYNCGENRVHSWESVDAGTTGQDYSNDVLARAQHLKNRYRW